MDFIVDHNSDFNDFHAIINSEKMAECFLSNGDIVEIYNENSRFLIAVNGSESCPSDRILLSRALSINSNFYMGNRASIRPYKNCPSADSVVFVPIEDTVSNITGPYDIILNKVLKNLQGIPILKNFIIPVYELNRAIEFRAVTLSPSNAVIVNNVEVVSCKNDAVPRNINNKNNDDENEESSIFNDVCFDDIGGFFAKEDSLIRKSLISKESNVFFISTPSGCGKSLLGDVIQNETDMYFSILRGYQLLAISTQLAIKQIESIVTETLQNSPSVLFIDDFDQIAEEMIYLVDRENEEYGDKNQPMKKEQKDYTLSKCLYDQFKILKATPNVVVFCTMKTDSFPAAFREQTIRIDVPLPDFEQRLSILEALTRKMSFNSISEKSQILKLIARNTKGQTGADLLRIVEENAVNQLSQFPNNSLNLTIDDFTTKLCVDVSKDPLFQNLQQPLSKSDQNEQSRSTPAFSNLPNSSESNLTEDANTEKQNENEKVDDKQQQKTKNTTKKSNENQSLPRKRIRSSGNIDDKDAYDDYYEDEYEDQARSNRKISGRKPYTKQSKEANKDRSKGRKRKQIDDGDEDYYNNEGEEDVEDEKKGSIKNKKQSKNKKGKTSEQVEGAEEDYESENEVQKQKVAKNRKQSNEENTQAQDDEVSDNKKDCKKKNKDQSKSKKEDGRKGSGSKKRNSSTEPSNSDNEDGSSESNQAKIANSKKNSPFARKKSSSTQDNSDSYDDENKDDNSNKKNVQKNPKTDSQQSENKKLDKNTPFAKKKDSKIQNDDYSDEENEQPQPQQPSKSNETKPSKDKEKKNSPFQKKKSNQSDYSSDDNNEKPQKGNPFGSTKQQQQPQQQQSASEETKPSKDKEKKNSPFQRKKSNQSDYSSDDNNEKPQKGNPFGSTKQQQQQQQQPQQAIPKPSDASSDSDDLQLHQSRAPAAAAAKKKKSSNLEGFTDPFSEKKAVANLPQRKVEKPQKVAAGIGVDPFAGVPKKEKLNLDLIPKKKSAEGDEDEGDDVSIGVEVDQKESQSKNPFGKKGAMESDSYSEDEEGDEKKKTTKKKKREEDEEEKMLKQKQQEEEQKMLKQKQQEEEQKQKQQQQTKKTVSQSKKIANSPFGVHVVAVTRPKKQLKIAYSESGSEDENEDDVSPQQSSSSDESQNGRKKKAK